MPVSREDWPWLRYQEPDRVIHNPSIYQPPGELITEGLLERWLLDGNATSWTGTRDGTLVGSATWTDGPSGRQALRATGTAGYIDVGSFQAWGAETEWSLTAWIRANDFSAFRPLLGYVVSGVGYRASYFVSNRLGAHIDTAGGDVATEVPLPYLAGWQHVAIVVASNTLTVYRNGALVGSTALAGAIANSVTTHVLLGARLQVNGTIAGEGLDESDLRVYAGALTLAQIVAIAAGNG